MKQVALAAGVLTLAILALLAYQPSAGLRRFQLMDSPPITVLDTKTGDIWVASSSEYGGSTLQRLYYEQDGVRVDRPTLSD